MKTLTIASLIILLSFISSSAQNPDLSWALWKNGIKYRWFNYHFEKEDALKMTAKWDEIGIGLEESKNKFAGTYFQYGYMSGYFLRWSSEKGYIYIQYFDIEHPCSFSYGNVSVNNLEITFIPEYEKNVICPSILPKTTPRKWIPALGGKYFIPANEAERFGNFYGGFGEFNRYYWDWHDAHPFARKWGDKLEINENFILPKPYEKFVKKPINAEITFVGKAEIKKLDENENALFQEFIFNHYYSETPVKIDVGKNLGVTKGLEFIIPSEGDSQTLKVTKVRKNSSEAIVLRSVNEEKKEVYRYYDVEKQESFEKEFPPLKIGQKITTSMFVEELLLTQE